MGRTKKDAEQDAARRALSLLANEASCDKAHGLPISGPDILVGSKDEEKSAQ
jgi:hypothetical protein